MSFDPNTARLDEGPAPTPAAKSQGPTGLFDPRTAIADDAPPAREVVRQAVKVKPEAAAEADRLSRRYPAPYEVVKRNADDFQMFDIAERVSDELSQAPHLTAAFRNNPRVAELAHDDVPTLAKIERTIGNATRYVMGAGKTKPADDIRAAGKAIDEAGVTLGLGATVGVGKMAFDIFGAATDLLGLDGVAASARNNANRAGEAMDAEGLQPTTSTGKAVKSGLQSAGTNLALLPAGLARGLYATASQAATTVAGLMGAGVGADAYNEARDKGKGKTASLAYGIPQGVFEFVFEKIPAQKLFGDLASNAGLMQTLKHQAFSEVWTEQMTTLAQDFNTWMNLNPERTLADFIAERPEAAYQTLVATLVGVGVQTTTIHGINKAVEKAADTRLQFEQDLLEEQMKLAATSALRERSPEQFRTLMAQIVETSDAPQKSIHVDAQVLNQLSEDVLAQLPESVRAQIPAEAAKNGTVEISIADVLTVAPGTPLEQVLNDNARMTPEALSRADALAAGDKAQVLRQEAEQVIQQAQDQAAAQADYDQVQQMYAQQVAASGRYRPAVADAMGHWLASFYTAYGSRSGMTAVEMQARYPVRVLGEATTDADVLNDTGLPGAITVDGYHFSAAARPTLSTAFYGTGLKGSAREEITSYPDKRVGQRLSFYVDKGTGIRPEAGVGGVAHRAKLSNVYDANADPLKLRSGDALAFESKLLDLGYSGYLDRMEGDQPGQVVMLGDQAIQAEVLGPLSKIDTGERVPALQRKEAKWQTIDANLTRDQAERLLAKRQAMSAWSGYELMLRPDSMDPENFFEIRSRKRGDVFEQPAVIAGLARIEKNLTKAERDKLNAGTSQRLVDLFDSLPDTKDFAAAAWAGRAKRGWYKQSAAAIGQIFGPDAPRFAGLLAAMSPQTSVQINLLNALRTWKNWTDAGRPQTREEILQIMGRSVEGRGGVDSVLDAWVNNSVRALTTDAPGVDLLSGPKVDSFMRNLLGDVEQVTNDAWMANFALVDQKMFKGGLNKTDAGKGPGYLAMSAKVRAAAKMLSEKTGETWTPAEVQETIWSWAKTLYEAQVGGVSATDILYNEELTDDMIRSTPDFKGLFHDEQYASILRDAGYGNQLAELDPGQPADEADRAARETAPFDSATQSRLEVRSAKRLEELKQRGEGVGREEAPDEGVYNQAGDGAGRYSSGGLAPLEGAPAVEGASGPDPRLVAVAEKYAASQGLTLRRQGAYVQVDEARAARIAQAYDEMKHDPQDPAVKAAYDDLIRQTLAQYLALQQAGYTFTFFDSKTDPYAGNPWNAMRDLRANQTMAVYGTYEGFGSSDLDVSQNPLLADTGLEWPDQNGVMHPVLANDLFRYVHDAFGHGLEGAGFRAQGEENAWQAHVRLFTGPALGAITSETRGQNSWLNYGPHGAANRNAKVEDTVFADQKTGLMPEWTWTEGRAPDEQSAFDKWFGGSKVVGADGKPLVVYHGTPADFEAFDTSKIAPYDPDARGNGFNFSSETWVADLFTRRKGSVIPAYLSIKNPVSRGKANALAERYSFDEWMARQPAANTIDDAVRLELESMGYDGIRRSATHWIAFRPEQIKSAIGNDGTFDANDPSILSQRAATPRGTFNPATLELVLNPNANLSTFFHETGHFFLEVMADIASQPGAPAQITEDMATFLKWAGFKDLATWNALDLEGKRTAHERWAESIEQYVMEGRAPSVELQPLMRRFATWLKSVYGSIKAFLTSRGQAAPGGAALNQSAFHGTPHRFDKFTTDKIGTGEGAQAYGWGLYFASKKGIAEHYRKMLLMAKGVDLWTDELRAQLPPTRTRAESDEFNGLNIKLIRNDNLPAAEMARWRELKNIDTTHNEAIARLQPKGQLYEVDIPEDSEMLLWDRPLSEQPEGVRKALSALIESDVEARRIRMVQDGEAESDAAAEAVYWRERYKNARGGEAYKGASVRLGSDKAVSEAMMVAGIKGIKYLDGTSRNAGDGTHNYVIFSGDDVAIRQTFYQDPTAQPGPPMALNDDIRRVMDRMLATDTQIAEANEVSGLLPDLEADALAAERLNKRSMADLKWSVRALDAVIMKLRKQAKAIEKTIRSEVTAEVNAMREVQARDLLAKSQKDNDGKLNETERAIIADAFSYGTVDEMLQSIDAFGSKADVIDGMTQQRMLEEHGDLTDDDAIRQAALEAVHNEARARSLATELRTQSEMLNPRTDTGETNAKGSKITVNALIEAAKQFAANVVARTPLRDLKSKAWQHTAAERRAGQRWTAATAAGKTQDAVQAKQDQMLNHAAAKAALDARQEMGKILEFFKRVVKGNDEKVVEKGRDADVVNAARAVLAAYGIETPASKGAEAYLEVLQRNDPETHGVVMPMVQGALQNAQPIEALTFEELQALHEEIQAMWYLAKRSRQSEIDGNLLDRDDLAQELRARMEEIGIPDRVPGEGKAVTKAEDRALFLRQGVSFLRRVEQWAEGFDGKYGGPFLRYVFQPVKDAANRYRTDRTAYRKKLQALVDNIAPIVGDQIIKSPELRYEFGTPGSTKGTAMNEVLHAIAHTGNESNKRKLLLGRGWATENPDGTLDTSKWDAFIARLINEGKLEQAHFDFVQGLWDLMEETKPLAQKAHRDAFGRYFAEVTADAFVDPFGVPRRGGYAPAIVDAEQVKDNELRKLAESENENMAFAFPAPGKGFTKGRVEYNRPLLLDLRTLSQHLDKVLLFSHMTGPARDVRRLITDKSVGQALTRIDPSVTSGMLQPWLQRSAQQVVEDPIVGAGKWARVPSIIRARAGAALMFANVSNTIQQVTGLSTALVKVGPAHMMRAVAQHVAHPVKSAQAVWEASTYMDDRAKNEVAVMNEQLQDILLNPSVYEKAQAWSMRNAYFLQTAVDNALSPIVWTGAYNQAMTEGMTHDDAVRFADGTVRQTQGSTLPEDVSRFETGPAYARAFTQFIGYFNMVANTNATALQQIAGEVGLKKGAGRALGVVMAGLLVPLWVAEAIAQAFRGGPDDEDKDGYLDDWLAAVFGFGAIKGLLAMIPIAGQAANSAVSRLDNNPMNDRISLSPGLSLLESALGGNVQTVSEILDSDKEVNARRAVRDAATLVSVFTGLPAYAVARPVGYLTGIADDKIEPTGPLDVARGLVTGVPSPDSKVK